MSGKMDKEVEKRLKEILKMLSDYDKRLKFVEERGKVLADSLTKGKDIEKLLDVYQNKLDRERKDSMKAIDRRAELEEKSRDAYQKEMDAQYKDYDKEFQKHVKEMEKQRLDARLALLESKVAKLES